MLSIIYPYRNRDLQRIENSLNSLKGQSVREFEVFLVDYGSENGIAKDIKNLCSNYNFVKYSYLHTHFQPWNKSRALNSVIKNLTTEFCFVADVDMIFHPDFIEHAIQLQQPDKTVYFQVGFLSPTESLKSKKFNEYKNYRKSNWEATGLSMFPVKVLQELRGFDEFYHFWGAEDTDMHVRIRNAGYEVEFYDKMILMLHQWHSSYRSKETEKLTMDLQIKEIVQLNHQHLKFAIDNNQKAVNPEKWGEVLSKADVEALENAPVNLRITNERRQINDLLFGQLPVIRNEIFKIEIVQDSVQQSQRYRIKKLIGKKVPVYYSFKEINDMVLLHLISFYRNNSYNYKVDIESSSITISVKL